MIIGSSAHAASGVVRPAYDSAHTLHRFGVTESGKDDSNTLTDLAAEPNMTPAEKACLEKQASEIYKVGFVRTDVKRFSYWIRISLYVAAKAPKNDKGLQFIGTRNGKVELLDDYKDTLSVITPYLSADGKCFVMDTETVRRRYYETFYPEQSVKLPDIPL